MTISKLASNPDTKEEFKQMIGNQHLPAWITQGGADSPGNSVQIGGKKYVVLTSCKPHDCGSQCIAVLYTTQTKKIAGVFSSSDEMEMSQKLQWISIPDSLSIDGKTVLFAALTGSLEHVPDGFNFK
ncbi:TPA: Ivy family C-type lysozyme inhibitor [Salmonella enterica subsp. enterica serovar Poona]